MPGIRKTKAPWPPEYRYLADRLAPLGLTTLGGHNGLVLHFHTHIDIFVDGKKVKVPALVGINPGAGYLTELFDWPDAVRVNGGLSGGRSLDGHRMPGEQAAGLAGVWRHDPHRGDGRG